MASVSNWGISILTQMTADIMSCKYIAEAQKIAALSAMLPQNANAILYRAAVEELFLDMVAHENSSNCLSVQDISGTTLDTFVC